MPYMVMVRCPTVDKAVPTGITCDLAGFTTLTSPKQLRCPQCADIHEWSLQDAWLRDRAYATGTLQVATAAAPESEPTFTAVSA
jgi:hypothetical protein